MKRRQPCATLSIFRRIVFWRGILLDSTIPELWNWDTPDYVQWVKHCGIGFTIFSRTLQNFFKTMANRYIFYRTSQTALLALSYALKINHTVIIYLMLLLGFYWVIYPCWCLKKYTFSTSIYWNWLPANRQTCPTALKYNSKWMILIPEVMSLKAFFKSFWISFSGIWVLGDRSVCHLMAKSAPEMLNWGKLMLG